jgi:hypothetical protein
LLLQNQKTSEINSWLELDVFLLFRAQLRQRQKVSDDGGENYAATIRGERAEVFYLSLSVSVSSMVTRSKL